jgi:hexulose-6-phosphate isomerase
VARAAWRFNAAMTNRRQFMGAGLGAGMAAAAAMSPGLAVAAAAKAPKLRKAVKFGMIKQPGASVEDKFALIKSLGFEGVEMDSPAQIDRQEVVKARDKTGVVIHGVVDSIHWKQRLSDPDPEVRAKGLAGLKGAIEDARLYGATTVLLVPGKVVKDSETFEQVWQRSQAEVRKVLPLARKLKIKIAIEVVWNDFLTTPENLIKYIDEFKDPTVGAYFDVSNMIKYGVPPATWIRKLGKRMLKFDFKGYSNEKKWVDIGDGDEDWPEVRKALAEIGYNGWATSEVSGGGEKELREVALRMNRVLGLA